MLEKDFAQQYRAMQENEHAPSQLVEKACAQARRSDAASKAPAVRSRRRTQGRRWPMRVAACLVAALVLFGGAAAVLSAKDAFDQPQARAYAATPNLLTAELGDGVVPFALDSQTAFQGWGRDELGCYTGMQFTLEGDGISRVQATISRGELYRMTTETHDRTTEEGKAILDEAVSWKPSVRGTGEYLGAYDWVSLSFVEDGLDRSDPNHQTQLRMIKRIGSTVDLPYEGEDLTFGLWFGDLDIVDALPDLHQLDGTELVITAVYDDGTCRTQTMTLHDGWFACSPSDPQQGSDFVMAEGPFDEKPKNSSDRPPYSEIVNTLYGEVTSVVDGPHPYPLENANMRADETPVPYAIEDELPSYGSTLIIGDAPPEERLFQPDDIISAQERITDSNDWADLQWSAFSARTTDALGTGEYIQPSEGRDVIAFQGNYEYLKRVREKTNDWSIDENGVVNEGNSIVVVDVNVTNPDDESVKISTSLVGAICAIDRDANTTTFATPGVFAAKDHKARLWAPGHDLWLDPGETVNLQVAFIVDASLMESGKLYYVLGALDGLEQGNLLDSLDANSYVALGTLETDPSARTW